MIAGDFRAAWPDYFDVIAEIEWSHPVSHEHLFSAGIPENDTAYFYSIVAESRGEWWPYYIGMTCKQTVAKRNQQPDHQVRLAALQESHPSLKFMLTLGTPMFERGSPSDEVIGFMEGLLIYGNWHEEMVNLKKIQTFNSVRHVFIQNIGWSHHVEPELAFGVFYKGRA